MTITLDLPTARKALAEIVKGREAYVYDGQDASGKCYYFKDNGAPSCIIGHLLAKLGVTVEQVRGSDENACAINNLPISDLLRRDGFEETDGVTTQYLSIAQGWQDHKQPWGEAFAQAEAFAEDTASHSHYA